MAEDFSGDFVGVGTVRFLMVTQADGSAHFTGMERFVGKLGEFSGSFIFAEFGNAEGRRDDSKWLVIPGSGSEELAGTAGEVDAADGCRFDYWFE